MHPHTMNTLAKIKQEGMWHSAAVDRAVKQANSNRARNNIKVLAFKIVNVVRESLATGRTKDQSGGAPHLNPNRSL